MNRVVDVLPKIVDIAWAPETHRDDGSAVVPTYWLSGGQAHFPGGLSSVAGNEDYPILDVPRRAGDEPSSTWTSLISARKLLSYSGNQSSSSMTLFMNSIDRGIGSILERHGSDF